MATEYDRSPAMQKLLNEDSFETNDKIVKEQKAEPPNLGEVNKETREVEKGQSFLGHTSDVIMGVVEGIPKGASSTAATITDLGISAADSLQSAALDLVNLPFDDEYWRKKFLRAMHTDNVGDVFHSPKLPGDGVDKELPKALSQFIVNYVTFGKVLDNFKKGKEFQEKHKHLSTIAKGGAADATSFYGEGNMSEFIQTDETMQKWIKDNRERYPEGVWENVEKLLAGSTDWVSQKLQTKEGDSTLTSSVKHMGEGVLLGELFEVAIRTAKATYGGVKAGADRLEQTGRKDFTSSELDKAAKEVEKGETKTGAEAENVNVVDDAVDAVDDAVENPYKTDDYIDKERGAEFEANSKDISGSSDVVGDILSELDGQTVKSSVKGVDEVLDDTQLEELYSTVFTPEKQTVSSAVTDVNYKSNRLPRSVEPLISWAEGFFKNGGKNFDPGGGAGEIQTARLKDEGVENIVLDPFNRSKEHNIEAIKKVANGQADTATVNNLLNVLVEVADRVSIYKQVKNALKEDGQAAFANWRDPKQAKAMADAGETSKVRTDKAGNKIAGQTHMADEAYVKELEEVFGKGNVKIVKVPKANGKGTENIIIATKKTVKETPTPKLTDTRITWDNVGQYAKNIQELIKEIPNIPKELADKIQNTRWKKDGGKHNNPLTIISDLMNKADGVGKKMGDNVYAHVDYIADVVPKEIFEPMIAALKKAGHNPNLFTFNKKTGELNFTESLDFDTVHEPSIAARYKVGVGGVVEKSTERVGQLYHHKWLWVKNDYKGFNYGDEKIRSVNWLSARGDDWTRSTQGSIGKKENWEKLWEEKISPNLVRISKGMDEQIDDIAEEGADALDNSVRPMKGVKINRDEYNEFIKRLNKGEVTYDDAGGIDFNFDMIDSELDVKAIINLLSEVAGKTIDKAKGGVRTFKETEELAELVGTNKEDLTALYKNTKNLDSKILAFRQLLNSSAAELDRLTKLVEKPNHYPADEVAMRRQAAIHTVIQAEVKGIQTNVARALNAMKIASRTGNYSLMIDEMGGSDNATLWAQKYQKAVSAIEQNNHVRNTALGRARGVLEEIWINSLLSGIPTQLINIAGNTTMIGLNLVERIGAGVIGSGRRLLGNADATNSTSLTEAYHAIRGSVLGLKDAGHLNLRQLWTDTADGMSAAFQVLKSGKTLRGKLTNIYPAVDEMINSYKGSTVKKIVDDVEVQVPAYGAAWRTAFSGNPILDNITKIESSGVDMNAVTSGNLNPRGALAKFADSDSLDFQASKDLLRFGLGVGIDMLGTIIRTPGRTLIATDELFKGVAFRSELHQKAYNITSRWAEGVDKVTGKPRNIKAGSEEFNAHYEKLLKNPPQELHITSLEQARYQTFTNELGSIGSKIQKVGEASFLGVPVGKYILPFVRTPLNIFKVSFERIPVVGILADSRVIDAAGQYQTLPDLLKAAQDALSGNAGGAARDEIIARWGLFTYAAMTLEDQFATGAITGAGHIDKDVRATAKAGGWQPYSIKIGDTYYAYNRLDPLGGLLGAMADYHLVSEQMADYGLESEMEKWNVAIFLSFKANFMDKTYMEGLQNLMRGFQDESKSGGKKFQNYVGKVFSSYYPTFLAQRTRSGVMGAEGDPQVKEYFNWFDAFKARIPAYSKEVNPRRDFLGNPITYDLGGWKGFISPIFESEISENPIVQEVIRLKIGFQKIPKTYKGVELSPKSHDALGKIAGKYAEKYLTELLASHDYKVKGSDGEPDKGREGSRAIMIKDIVSSSRSIAYQHLLLPYLDKDGYPTDKVGKENPDYDKKLSKEIRYDDLKDAAALVNPDAADRSIKKQLEAALLEAKMLEEELRQMKKLGSID